MGSVYISCHLTVRIEVIEYKVQVSSQIKTQNTCTLWIFRASQDMQLATDECNCLIK